MVQINFAQKTVTAKIVYYGPGMSGKTTNLEVIHQRAPERNKGDLTSISTDGDRTLFFDFMPLDLGTVAGMRTCFQIYTVPGQVYYNSTRKLVLQGCDGVVFVADSSASMAEENLESYRNLEENLAEYGKSIASLPHVLQWNKRDLPDAMSCEQLDELMNKFNVPTFEAVANTGQGVFPTLKALAAKVLETIHANHLGGSAPPAPEGFAAEPAPAAPVAAAPAPMPEMAAPPAQAMPEPQQAMPQQAMPQPMPAPAAPMPAAEPAPMPVAAQMPPTPMQPAQAPPPVQPEAHGVPGGLDPLTQTQFQQPAASLPQQPMPAAPQPPMQSGAPLQMAQTNMVARPSGAAASAMVQQAQTTFQQAPQSVAPLMQPGDAAATTRRPAAQQAAASQARPLEGTRFKPRSSNRPVPRPTPVATKNSGGNWVYTAVFVTLALAVGAVVTRIVLSFFV